MTADVQYLLHSFDSLPDPDKRTLATEILRRSLTLDQPPLSDESLTELADSVFQQLDQREDTDA